MLKRLFISLGLASLLFSAGTAEARPGNGGYFGFDLGYAFTFGDRGVPLRGHFLPSIPTPEEWVRTDFGAGMAFNLRVGWRIGPIAPEISAFGHGAFDFKSGAGYPAFNIHILPLAFFDSLDDFPFDFSLYAGVGYAISGYHHKGDSDAKGWDGVAVNFGVNLLYDITPGFHLGVDVKFGMPQYLTWMFNRTENRTFAPKDVPHTLIIAPTLSMVADF